MDNTIKDLCEILRSNNIDRTTAYAKFRKQHGGVFNGIYMPVNPWQSMMMSAKEFFDMIFPRRKEHHGLVCKYKKIERKSLEDHFRLMATNKLYTEKLYVNFLRKNRAECKGYYQCPWVAFKMPIREFFDLAFPERSSLLYSARIKKTEMDAYDHLRIIIANKLTSAKKYRQFYLENRDKMDLISRPWDRFGMSESAFFDSVKNSKMLIPKGVLSHEQCERISV